MGNTCAIFRQDCSLLGGHRVQMRVGAMCLVTGHDESMDEGRENEKVSNKRGLVLEVDDCSSYNGRRGLALCACLQDCIQGKKRHFATWPSIGRASSQVAQDLCHPGYTASRPLQPCVLGVTINLSLRRPCHFLFALDKDDSLRPERMRRTGDLARDSRQGAKLVVHTLS